MEVVIIGSKFTLRHEQNCVIIEGETQNGVPAVYTVGMEMHIIIRPDGIHIGSMESM
jgi:hypothetical protein